GRLRLRPVRGDVLFRQQNLLVRHGSFPVPEGSRSHSRAAAECTCKSSAGGFPWVPSRTCRSLRPGFRPARSRIRAALARGGRGGTRGFIPATRKGFKTKS